MKKAAILTALVVLSLLGAGLAVRRWAPSKQGAGPASRTLEIFVGTASKPATEVIVAEFERRFHVDVRVHFGGSGKMLADLALSGRGDIYFSGSSDYMAKAKRKGLVMPETEHIAAYLAPAILVARGNPRGLHGLADLARPGLRVAIARPDSVCVGLYAVELLYKAGLYGRVKGNLVAQAESCERTAQLVSLGLVDAALGWRVFEAWDRSRLEAVALEPRQVCRIGYLPLAVATSTQDKALAQQFVDFVCGPFGRGVFRRLGYASSEAEARRWAGPGAAVGGEWRLPEGAR